MRKKKPLHPIFKHPYVKTALRSLVAHLGYIAYAYILYLLILSNIMRPMITDGLFSGMRWLLAFFSLFLYIVLQGLLISAYNKDEQNKRRYLDMTKEAYRWTSVPGQKVLRLSLTESLLSASVAALLQLPSALFYEAYSFDFEYALFFEKFQIGWIGLYLLFDSAFIGILFAFVIGFMFAFLGRVFSHRSWEENRVRRSEHS